MKQKLALLLTGLLVGGFLMTVLPVGAHHQPAQKRLAQRVNRLTNRLNTVQTKVNNRTQLLDRDGFYLGSVIGPQVISLCDEETAAMWKDTGAVFNEVPITFINDCFEEKFPSGAGASSQRQLQRTFGR